MKQKLPTRWNLSDLGSKINDPKFLKERELHERAIKKFAKKWKKDQSYLTDMDSLKKALDQSEAMGDLPDTEGMYLFLMRQVDTGNSKLAAAEKKYTEWAQNLSNEIRFFGISLGKIDTKLQKKILKDERFSAYKNHLKGIFETAKFDLSEKEEKILSLKSGVSAGNWASMMEEKFAHETRDVLTMGKGGARPKKTVSFTELFGLMQATCSRVRKSAALAVQDVLEKNAFFVEKEFNSILENKKINDELRGFERPDQARILSDDISFEIVDTLSEVVESHFKFSRDFYSLKAKLMKKDKLDYYERSAPFGKSKKEYSYTEAFDLVEKSMEKIDPEFAEIHRDMCENGRVDVMPKSGKRGGAFCMYHGKNEPVYIMLNHTGKTRDVSTLAHEMGHAIHGTLAKRENNTNYGTPMFMAEIASTFCEEYVFDEIVDQASDKEKLNLYMQKMSDSIATIHRQIAGYLFERDVHKAFREKGYLSNNEIGDIFEKNMKSYMGPKVLQNYGAKNWWMYWSHFRSPFYVYSYSSGLLIANGMRAILREKPEQWEKVKEFFYTGESLSPEQVFNKMGIDITDPFFWEAGLSELTQLMKETKKLAKKLGKI
ncbi:MAG: M3 family oligoendopeptidase [Candidatus Pacebacteria bacterium]|nr:M3 family oligoendopeptidase [Candidatus Paceibacterota bacterium]